MTKYLIAALIVLIHSTAYATDHREEWYEARWCDKHNGNHSTQVDCITDTHAIEFDFGDKWSEAIGQSLTYALETNKKAGIVLILESAIDYKYWIKLNTIIEHYKLPIDTWMTGKGAATPASDDSKKSSPCSESTKSH